MAGLRVNANSGEVVLVANTAKTVLQIKAPTNQRLQVRMKRLGGKQPAGGTDTPVKVRFTRSTANFGTGTAVTLVKYNPSDPETIQSTAFCNFTVEPTTPADAGEWFELQPQSSIIEMLPQDLQIPVPGGASLNLEATSTGTPTLDFQLMYEE